MLTNQAHLMNIETPVRQIQAKAELYNGSALINSFFYTDDLISFEVVRVGEGKFFGYGYTQKANIKLIDTKREKNITTANSFNLSFGVNGNYLTSLPSFKVTEVNRDENTNELSITAYDLIKNATNHTVAELNIVSYTIKEFAEACATLLGAAALSIVNVNDFAFDTAYENGANYDGTETIREALDAIAEATQTIYFVDASNNLVFKRLDVSGDAVYTIDKAKYIDLSSKTNRRLSKIVHATELGDNVSVEMTEAGSTQYVRNNPFWDLREDINTLLDNALAAIGGLTINQFECEWRGNYLLEIGDKINITTKNGNTVTSYLLDDTLTYNGMFKQVSQWKYEDNEDESEDNPNTLGEALKQTYARVDKANKQIDIVAGETEVNKQNIASIQLNTESITASVNSLKDETDTALESVNNDVAELSNKVSATMTSEQVQLEIQSQLSNGVSKVETTTGFTFDDTGLTVRKTDSEMTTTITEDGMTVYKNDEAVLTANNVGVDALNLHATTYLIIGTNSRFEDFGDNRTGCFWIGG